MIKLTQLDYQYDNLTMSFDFSVQSGESVAVMAKWCWEKYAIKPD